MEINKDTTIKLFDMKTRIEDFGNLVTDGYHYSVVDNNGLQVIEHMNKYNKLQYYKVDTVITDYLNKFVFENDREREKAYKSLLEFIGVLSESRIIFPRKKESL